MTTPRRTPAERRAHRCAICLPATDDTIAGGTDHRVEDHDEVCDEADHDANVKWLR